MKTSLSLSLGIFILLLSGCASVPMASPEQDAKAKAFLPSPDKAALYIYRNETFGAAIPMTVSVNGTLLGQTAAYTYFQLNLTPGKYDIESHAENISTLSLVTEAGKNYFVWQEVKMGMWMARSLLQQMDETLGRAGIMESKLIATAISGDEIMPLDTLAALPTTSQETVSPSVSQKLRELRSLRDEGIITENEFQQKKTELLQTF